MLLKITCFCRFDMEESNTSSSLIFYLSSLYSCLDLSTNGCKMRLIEMYDKIIDLNFRKPDTTFLSTTGDVQSVLSEKKAKSN